MKYIKNFENKNYGSYWIVPTDSRLIEALKILNCSDWYINILSNNEELKKCNYIFIRQYYNGSKFTKYGWNPLKYELRDLFLEKNGCEFKGYIMTTEYEVKLSIESKKYNL